MYSLVWIGCLRSSVGGVRSGFQFTASIHQFSIHSEGLRGSAPSEKGGKLSIHAERESRYGTTVVLRDMVLRRTQEATIKRNQTVNLAQTIMLMCQKLG